MLLRETEMQPGPQACIDTMSVEDAGQALIAAQEKAVRAVNSAMPQLRQAAEIEDDLSGADDIVDRLGIDDLVIALSASGSTPYSCEIAKKAHAKGIKVIAITNNPATPLLDLADVAIVLPTRAEVLAGSTRLGAGTAQKVALNVISTLAAVQLGHVFQGMMVNLKADNAKLRGRAVGIVANIASVSEHEAERAFIASARDLKLAVLLAKGCDAATSKSLLAEHQGRLGGGLGALENLQKA
ncbi:N-acetylmuramic acid 6-phosphate etherase [Paracoccaceae bacterium]|nr:N-acetylmuramic acid 6-phosphate etherase [Paracoccaceae bacterium]